MNPADQETRERVLAPDKSFIVQAPAGSGKTELLVRRYLRLLSVVAEPEEIIAITFTRKAAAEMRGRIIAALVSAGSADPGDNEGRNMNTEIRRQLAARARGRDEELGWQLTDNPARMKIQTIDSFCAGLTQQMPVLSKLGGLPEIIEDAGDLYREAAANTLGLLDNNMQDDRQAEWSTAVETLLAHLDNDLPRVRDMLVSMLRKRDQWLRRLLAGELPERRMLEQALRHIVETTLKDSLKALPQELIPEFTDCLRFATNNLADVPFIIDDLPGSGAGNLQCWQFIVSLCLTGKGDWRKRVSIKEGFPPGNEGKDMKHRFQSLLSLLGDDERLLELFQEIRGLPRTDYRDDEWRVIEALYRLLELANAELYRLFAERNQVDFTGSSLAALQALGAEEDPTDLALYLDYRIRHILVDEYQDVSINQYELLKRLTAGWSMEDGHSLFLVGDPMQSIYRFRDAEVGVFLNTWFERRLGQMPIEPVSIEVNFRSDRSLVDWVNTAFPAALPGESDPVRGAVSFTPAIAHHPHAGENRVQVHPILGRDDTREAQQVLAQVKAIRNAAQSESIAILVRNRSHLQAITLVLTQAGLRFRAVEIEHLENRPVIQDLLALTRALHHPADRVAWLALLRAPWCGLSLADLLALGADTRNDTIWHILQDRQRRATLSADGQRRVARVCNVLEQALTRHGRMPLRRWVKGAWLNLGGPATLDSVTDLHDADRFFDLLDELDAGGDLRNLNDLIERVDNLYAGADIRADDSLQVMSIHKAKGLEFDHVILPGLSRRSRSDDTQLLLWSENPYPSGSDLLLAPVKASHEDTSSIYNFINSLEKQKQRHEEGRLLYVAATRARKQLHLIGSVETDKNGELSKPPDNTLLGQLWPAVEKDFQTYLEQQAPPAEQVPPPVKAQDTHLRRLTVDWQLPPPPPAVRWATAALSDAAQADPDSEDSRIEYLWAGRTIMHAGTVVHRCLQVMAMEGIDAWSIEKIVAQRPHNRDSLYTLGVPEEELDKACNWVEQALTGILTDPRGRWLLADHREQASEYALSGIVQGDVINIVIDRTFVDENGICWIVDYKTSRHESGDIEQFLDLQQERYRGQLEKYAAIMSAMDDRPIRLGLYLPILRGWREWAYSP